MKLKLLKIILPLILVIIASFLLLKSDMGNRLVYAVGDLVVDWGIDTGDVGPIFNITNYLPGDLEQRTVNVSNGASSPRSIAIKGIKTSGVGNLENILQITLSDGGTDLYGGTTGTKTLKNFFDASNSLFGVQLFTLPGGTNKNLTIKVKFPESAGNEYQNTSVVFNIVIGVSIEIPAECANMVFSNVLLGTAGNDTLNGGVGSQLIIDFEGNDKSDGGQGDDCIVGNAGNDKLEGGAGKDVIIGGEGNNIIDGGAEKDLITSGSGNDKIDGGAEDDIIDSGAGNDNVDGGAGNDLIHTWQGEDKIDGGSGNDQIYAGTENDNIGGGAGNDQIFGEDGNDNIDGDAGDDTIDGGNGNDTIKGSAGNDNLIGGPDTDNLNGGGGTDTCVGEVKNSCEL